MTHELKKIIDAFRAAKNEKLKTVLATVVALEGSSYRRPGVRMLIREDGKMMGAVSGGCVEKEVQLQAQSVFSDGIPKMMTYDGRYRLGCEGILYILIEPFGPDTAFLNAFDTLLKNRAPFRITSHFSKKEGPNAVLGTLFQMDDLEIPIRDSFEVDMNTDKTEGIVEIFEQEMEPRFKLVIVGAEHDAVQLCLYASLTGWEVEIVAAASEQKRITDFPGAEKFTAVEPEMVSAAGIDGQTAVMVMTHSYVRDLKYLLALTNARPVYLGLLGPSERRERLLGECIERHPEVSDVFIDSIHGPAGLNIGAETAQEIALAIMAEILSVSRDKKPMMLKNKSGRIHG
ncbi:MAG TPA: XdhC family protein [Pricia sp.]|nr:XdhC family protein [Pricia sp.]